MDNVKWVKVPGASANGWRQKERPLASIISRIW